MTSSIGDKLTALRKEHNMTQADLGVKLCVSAQAVSKWERGQAEPDIDTLIKVSQIFSISMDELLKGEASPTTAEEPQASPEPQPKREETLGVCTVCGRNIYPANCGESKPVLVCKDCVEARKRKIAEEERRKAEERKKAALHQHMESIREMRNGLIWGAVAGVAGFILMMFLEDSIGMRILYGLIFGYGTFAFTSQVIWGNYVADLIVWFLSRTVEWPGIIFSFDLDGLMFLIAMKILFAVLGFLIGVALAVVGFIISVVCAALSFPFSCVAKWREAYC